MSGIIITKYLCDLCGQPAEEQGSSKLPFGWVKLVIESRYVERDFTDKHICKTCAHDIVRAATKGNSSVLAEAVK